MLLIIIASLVILGGISTFLYFYELGVLTIFFIIVASLLVLSLCTETGRKKFLRLCYRLGSDNNALIFPIWIAVAISALFSFDAMVRGNPISTPPSVSTTTTPESSMPFGLDKEWGLAWYKDECSKVFPLTLPHTPGSDNRNEKIQECAKEKEKIREKQMQSPREEPGQHWLIALLFFCWSWRTLTLFFLACGITLFVLRDEVGRGWKAAKDRVFTRKGWSQDLPDIVPPPVQAGGTNQGTQVPHTHNTQHGGRNMIQRLVEVTGVMFSFELLEEVFKHIMRSRRGGIL